MTARFLHPSAAGNAAARKGPSGKTASLIEAPRGPVGNACCCPARPAVRVVLPPNPSRSHSTELLLCGHHYRVSRAALATARAVVRPLPGTPEDVASWLGVEQLDAAECLG